MHQNKRSQSSGSRPPPLFTLTLARSDLCQLPLHHQCQHSVRDGTGQASTPKSIRDKARLFREEKKDDLGIKLPAGHKNCPAAHGLSDLLMKSSFPLCFLVCAVTVGQDLPVPAWRGDTHFKTGPFLS